MSCLCPCGVLAEAEREVEVIHARSLGSCGRHIDEGAVACGNGGQSDDTALDGLSVTQERVRQLEAIERNECVAVADAQLAVGHLLEIHILIHLLHLLQLGCHLTLRGDDAVAAEVLVVGEVAESAAIIEVVGRLAPLAQALIYPVPDAAAYHALALKLDIVPILLQVADGVAHSVGIFAQEIGAALLAGVSILAVHRGHAGIHTAVHIGHLIHSFIMYQSAVQLLDGLLACHEVVAASALVTHTPEDDGRMVAVAQHHTYLAIYILGHP